MMIRLGKSFQDIFWKISIVTLDKEDSGSLSPAKTQIEEMESLFSVIINR